MNKGKKEKLKEIRVRLTESLFSILQAKVQESGLSLNGYINFVLTFLDPKPVFQLCYSD